MNSENRVCDFMQKDEVVSYYDGIAGDYDESRFNNSYGKFIDAEERKILNHLIDTDKNELRLEMACGTGRLTDYATHALDASPEMMAFAQRRHPEVSYRCTSAVDTGFADGMFDVVYTFHLLMHLDRNFISDIFREVHRILKPGGRFIFDIPSGERRRMRHHQQDSWHGATHLSRSEVMSLTGDMFKCSDSYGIMMMPVHKLPVSLRKPLQSFDYFLANSLLRKYSSYVVYEFIKQ